MALAIADRVKETTTTTGTGTYSLGGASDSFQSVVAGIGDGNTGYFCCTDGTDREVFIGTVTAGTPDTLTRTTILDSSNGGAAVNWGPGTKSVFMVIPAGRSVYLSTDGTKVVIPDSTGTRREYALPNAAGTLVDLASAQTLTNKTISGGSINSTPIGATTPAAGHFTQMTVGINSGVYSRILSSSVEIVGGTGTGSGGCVRVFGPDHPTKASGGELRTDSTIRVTWDTSGLALSSHSTTANAANAVIDSTTGLLQRSTSSIRYKINVETMEDQYADAILQMRPVWYRSNPETCPGDNPAWGWWGLIAEEVALIDPRLVHWGRPTKEIVSTETVEVPLTETVTVEAQEITVVDGAAVLHTVQREVERAVVDLMPVVDEAGQPVTEVGPDGAQRQVVIEVPRMTTETIETVSTVPDMDAPLRPEAVQYERLTALLINLVQRHEHRITDLEARLAAAGL